MIKIKALAAPPPSTREPAGRGEEWQAGLQRAIRPAWCGGWHGQMARPPRATRLARCGNGLGAALTRVGGFGRWPCPPYSTKYKLLQKQGVMSDREKASGVQLLMSLFLVLLLNEVVF